MTAFPDAFVVALKDQLRVALQAYPDLIAQGFFTRPLRPDDPTLSVAIFESTMEPIEYEIGSSINPSLMRWHVIVQALVKSVDEVDGRSTRSKLLQRVRAALFSSPLQTALMTLRDSATQERVTKFRMRRIEFASGDGPRQGEMFFLGQVEIFFETEYR